MGSFLQEAIEIYSRAYLVHAQKFDVNAWRLLVTAFVEYVRDLDLTDEDRLGNRGKDGFQLSALLNIEKEAPKLVKVAKFLREIRPPDKYIYSGRDGVEEEDCPEMLDALKRDEQKELVDNFMQHYDAWLAQAQAKEDKENV